MLNLGIPGDFDGVVGEIEGFGIMPDRPPSLESMKAALALAGLAGKLDPGRVVVIAGTNGKGSTAALLEELLRAAGHRTGLYTSPHLQRTQERIRIDGSDLSEADFVRVYLQMREICLKLRLSHFETLTLMAVQAFVALGPLDWIVLEVGLGGTWDATNAVAHDHCVIASLGLDHQNLLGSTLVDIARNKFGIITEGANVVHAPLPEAVRALAHEVQARTRSAWRERRPFHLRVNPARVLGEDPIFEILTAWGSARLSLPGQRGGENAALALTVFESLGMDPGTVMGALSAVRWPGRMERIGRIHFSGDHNPAGIESLLELLAYYPRRHLHIVAGVGRDKDLDGVLAPLFRLEDTSVALTVTPFKGRRIEEYGEPWCSQAVHLEADPVRALEATLLRADPGDLVLVTGSLYLVGLLRTWAQERLRRDQATD